MMTFNELQDSLYQKLKLRSPRERRQQLTAEMAGLTDKKIDCFNCSGTCCTFSANSMRVTPIEAFEMIVSLEITNENISEIKNKLKKNILDYRLDHEIFLGKKTNSFLRKTYTCPFFVAGSKGCTIKKELKPYGCLGFNPRIENDNGSQCLSNIELLEAREETQREGEELANQFLKDQLQLDWEKCEIPKAILILLEKLYP